MVENIAVQTLVQLAEEVGGDEALDFPGRVTVANARPQELAKAIRKFYLDRWRLHELVMRLGWEPSAWVPYEGPAEAARIEQHLTQYLIWADIQTLFKSVLGFSLQSATVAVSSKAGYAQAMIGQFTRSNNSLTRIQEVISRPDYPIA